MIIRLKNLLTESVTYDYGCVMAIIPPSVAPLFVNFGKSIVRDDMLYFDPKSPEDFGREKEPHMTIKFGLTQRYSEEQMREFLKGTKPFQIVVKGLSIFQNQAFDVIKLDVEGPEL